MSTTIDSKIVEMKFDNAQFESGVKTSLSTLDKLKESLNFSGATKGIESIGSAARSVSLSPLGDAVEIVHAKFSALDVVAIRALSNITDTAIRAGKRLVSSLTVDQVTSGWGKYAEKTSAVQTIMAATAKDFSDTGEQMTYVNEQLEKLNWFTDETSYSFLDMVNNIGKFTSNNIALDKSVTAMEGISTWAAISGANVNEAGRAMYNLSQAMAVGSVKLMDWKSIENANMATAEFKQTAIDTAAALGTLRKKTNGTFETLKGAEVTVSNFNTALSDGWFSADVLMATLDKYGAFSDKLYKASEKTGKTATELLQDLEDYKAGTLSLADISMETGLSVSELTTLYGELSSQTYELGNRSFRAAQEAKTFKEAIDATKDAVSTKWTQIFETIFGNYEEAKRLWTDLANAMYDAFVEPINGIGTLVGEWKALGGRDVLIESFWNAWEAVGKVIAPIKKAFRNIFPAASGEALLSITYRLRNLTESLQISDMTAGKLTKVFRIFFNALKMGGNAVKTVWTSISNLLTPLRDAFHEMFPDALYRDSMKLAKCFEGLMKGLRDLTETFKIGSGTIDSWKKMIQLKTTFKGVLAAIDMLGQGFGAVWSMIRPLFSGFDTLSDKASSFLDRILDVTSAVGSWLIEMDHSVRENDTFRKALQEAIERIQEAITVVKNFADTVREKLHLPDIDTIRQKLVDFINTVKDNFAAPGFTFLQSVLEKIGDKLTDLKDTFGKTKEKITDTFERISASLQKSRFPEMLQKLWDTVKKIAGSISQVFNESMVNFFKMIGETDFSNLIDLLDTLSIGGIAVAIGKFLSSGSDALGELGSIPKTFNSLLGNVTTVLDQVRGCLEAYQTQLKSNTLLKIAGAVAILAASITVLTLLDPAKLALSLTAITTLFTELIGAMAIFGDIGSTTGKLSKLSVLMLSLSISVSILAGAVKKLAILDAESLSRGVIGITSVIILLVSALSALSGNQNGALSAATSLVVLSSAVKILAGVCKTLAKLDWSELSRGLAGVAALLGMIDIFLYSAKYGENSVAGAAGILVLATALKVLASVCKSFSSMTWEDISKGLIAVGALMTELTVAMTFLSESSGIGTGAELLLVSAALKVFASVLGDLGTMSWEDIAHGLKALGGALAELAIGLHLMEGTLSGSAALMVASLALAVLAPALKQLGGMSWEELGRGLAVVAGAFVVLAVAGLLLGSAVVPILGIAAAFALMGVGVLELGAGLVEIGVGLSSIAAGFLSLSTVGAAGATAVVAALTIIIVGVAETIPLLGQKIAEGIISFCQVLTDGAPAIGKTVVTIVETIITALKEILPQVFDLVVTLLDSLLNTLAEHMPSIVQAGMEILLAILHGIEDNIQEIVETAIDIVLNFIKGIEEKLPDIIQAGFDLLLSFINGISDAIDRNTPLMVAAMKKLFWSIVNAGLTVMGGGVDLFRDIGKKVMDSGLIKGIKNKLSSLKTTVGTLISNALQKIKDKFGSFTTAGKNLISKLIGGIREKASGVTEWITGMIEDAKTAVTDTFGRWYDIGHDMIQGMINGISDTGSALQEKASEMISNLPETAKKILGIASPSKVYEEIGRFSNLGLIKGLLSLAGKVKAVSESIGQGAIEAMSDTIGGLADLLPSDINEDITIRPVLDLSQVQNGFQKLYTLAQSVNGYSVAGSASLAERVSRAVSLSDEHTLRSAEENAALLKRASEVTTTSNQTIENVFHIHGNNPKEIAQEVSRIIQQQVERKEASWA